MLLLNDSDILIKMTQLGTEPMNYLEVWITVLVFLGLFYLGALFLSLIAAAGRYIYGLVYPKTPLILPDDIPFLPKDLKRKKGPYGKKRRKGRKKR